MARAKNKNLKKPHQEIEYTSEQVLELKRCAQDPVYFIKTYVQIQHPVKGAVPFILYDYQEKMVEAFKEHRFSITLSSRQTGKSITSAAYLLWFAMFNFDKTILIASNKNANAMEMILRIRFAYENLPFWIKPGVTDDGWNKHTIIFDNGSRIESTATSEDSGRGMSISLLFLDEFAFVKASIQDEFWTSISPTLSCVVGNTRVLTNNGYVKIEDFHHDRKIGDYFNIDNLTVWGRLGLEKVSHGYVSPESNTLIINTRHGLTLEVTKNHPLYKLYNMPIMTKALELSIGDFLRIDVGMNVYGTNTLDDDIAYMLGGYIAEGWMIRNKNGYHSIYISNNDYEFRDIFINNKIKKFVNNKITVDFDTKLKCHSKKLVSIFEEYGIDPKQKCYNKTIPEYIFGCNKKIIGLFLSGLFDGDGSVSERCINLTSTSKQLINDVQLLLLNMGIVTTILKNNTDKILERERKTNRIMPHGKPLQSLRDSWALNIPLSQYKKFDDCVGFKIKRKSDRLREIISLRNQDDFKHFTIPVKLIKSELINILESTQKTKGWFRKKGIRFDKCLDNHPKRKINQQWLQKLKRIIEENHLVISKNSYDFFDEFLTIDHFWDDIISITQSVNNTYDFTVPNTHSFLQNGIIGSNTGGSCIMASTPNGDQNIFAETWRSANMGNNGFYPIRVKWDEPPGRDDEFKQDEIGRIGQRRWDQEYACIFLTSDSLLIDSLFLINISPEIEAIVPNLVVNDVVLFEEIKPMTTYLLGVDPSTGSGEDFSVIVIYSFPSMVQVGEYRSNTMSTNDLYGIMKNILKRFEDKGATVYFSIENNGVGQGLIALYEADEEPLKTAEFISEEGKNKLGFTTTARSKMRACVNLKEMLEKRTMFVKSRILLSELKSYVRYKGAYAAQSGATDDCISATLIVLRLVEEIATYEQEAFDKLYTGDYDEWGKEDWDGYEENYDESDEGLPMMF